MSMSVNKFGQAGPLAHNYNVQTSECQNRKPLESRQLAGTKVDTYQAQWDLMGSMSVKSENEKSNTSEDLVESDPNLSTGSAANNSGEITLDRLNVFIDEKSEIGKALDTLSKEFETVAGDDNLLTNQEAKSFLKKAPKQSKLKKAVKTLLETGQLDKMLKSSKDGSISLDKVDQAKTNITKYQIPKLEMLTDPAKFQKLSGGDDSISMEDLNDVIPKIKGKEFKMAAAFLKTNFNKCTPDSSPINNDTPEFTQDQIDNLNSINAYRAAHGVAPLELHPGLNKAAQEHSDYMRETGDINAEHTGRDGATHVERIKEAVGLKTDSSVIALENISLNNSYEKSFDDWKDSPGHNENMLNPDVKYFGSGTSAPDEYGRVYSTQTFMVEPDPEDYI